MREKHLPKGHLNNVIRYVKNSSMDRAKELKTATFNTLERLGVKRDVRRARRKMPKGSDQGNVRSILDWMDRIDPSDAKAVRQVVEIDATCCRRVDG